MLSTVQTPLAELLESSPRIDSACTGRCALRVVFEHPQAKVIAVCDSSGHPVGLLNCSRLFALMTGPAGPERYSRAPVVSLMNPEFPSASLDEEPALVRNRVRTSAGSPPGPFVVITDSGRYAGVIPASKL
ncbi:hypothetical protein ACE6ED_08035 [Paenibacillus sp. CN-4]|uniref:hypothetical protein n=1 Tax=Paenibacillus nanchangensis TaxID=3348343 RepID=UPI00397E354C